MDSMMAVEIKQTLEREFQVFLTPQDIRGMTFSKLQDLAAQTENEPAASAQGDDISIYLSFIYSCFLSFLHTPWNPCPFLTRSFGFAEKVIQLYSDDF